MGRLVFKVTDELRRIVEHAEQNAPGLFYGEPIENALFMVKDHGAYLMSAGQPGLKVDDTSTRQVVVYAEGHDPNDPDWDYDMTYAECGGDDFAEPLGVEAFRRAIDEGHKSIIIAFTDTSITIMSR